MSEAGAVAAPAAAPAAQSNSAPAPASEPKQGGATAPVTPVEVDPRVEALRSKPFIIKNKAGKSVVIDSVEKLEHYASKGFGAELNTSRAQELEQQLAQERAFRERLKANPREVLESELGDDFGKLAAQKAIDDYERDLKMRGVPEELREKLLEAEALKKEKLQRQAEEQKWLAQQEEQKRLQEEDARLDVLLVDGVRALKAAGFAERPPPLLLHLLDPAMKRAEAMGLSPEIAAKDLREQLDGLWQSTAQSFVEAKDAEGLEKIIGPAATELLMRARLAKLRAPGAAMGATRPPTQPSAPQGSQSDDGLTEEQRLKANRDFFRR